MTKEDLEQLREAQRTGGYYEKPPGMPVIEWNYEETEELAKLKTGTVANEGDFIKTVEENFMPYYQPLIPWINRLRKVVFPGDGRWKKEDKELYSQMKAVLEKAKEDPQVLMEL
ncbi:MAG: hypothetical protein M1813_009627 [Trichoglossum hirsutum]|nr:MAG: hypothetical protein M1813_009627 [Trichoglossum hirsutum]